MGRDAKSFADRTVLLAGGGCALGRTMARFYAEAGARVVLIDRDEARIGECVATSPKAVELLALDLFDDLATEKFCKIWADEPLDALVHLQPFRHAADPGKALTSVVGMTEGLSAGLVRGQGRVLVLYREAGAAASLRQQSFAPAWDKLAQVMARTLGPRGLAINAIRLSAGRATVSTGKQILEAALLLTAPRPSELTGTCLHLGGEEA